MNTTEKALVLKVGRFREVDCWLKLLTPSRGIFNAFAFGGSKSRKRFCGCLDPFNLVLFSIGSSRTGEYTVLEEGTLLNGFSGLRTSPDRLGMGANCLKFVEAVQFDPQDAPTVFGLFLETLEILDKGEGNLEAVPWLFRGRLAFDLGLGPDFLCCGACGRPVTPGAPHFFNVDRGQMVCAACQSGGKPVEGLAQPVSAGALRALDWLKSSRPADWTTMCMEPDVARQCRQIIELFIAYHLGLSWDNGFYKKV